MRVLIANTFRSVLKALPPVLPLFKLARMYVCFYNGDDNTNFDTNGEARALEQLLPYCRVVFDVGANVGDWTEMALRILPDLEVHCFEPSAASMARLAARPFPPAVRRNPIGLSSRKTDAVLNTFGEAATTNSLYARDWGEAVGETIHLDTMDNYCRENKIEHIDFVKIDTEGHEFDVIKGMEELLEAGRVDAIQLEYSGAYIQARVFFRDVYERLTGRGFRCFKITPRGLKALAAYSESVENFMLSNWLFLREGHPLLTSSG